MREERYDYLLADDARLRVRFTAKRGKVVEFVAQLEFFGQEEWEPLVRYDSAHGFPHRDQYFPDGTVSKHEPLPASDLGEALTYAINKIKREWAELCQDVRRSGRRHRKRR